MQSCSYCHLIPQKLKSCILSVTFACLFCAETSSASFQVMEEPEVPTCRDILMLTTEQAREFAIRRQQFVEQIVSVYVVTSTSDSVTTFELQKLPDSLFYLTRENIGPIPYLGADPFTEEFRRANSDVPPMFNLNHFVGGLATAYQKWKRENRDSWPIPDNTEIEILNVLWRQDVATGSEIYALLDSTNHLASEEVQVKLQQMIGRGFVERKQLSPTQEFKLSGIFRIEVNPKNRKNRLYLYWPVVSRDRLISYIDSQRNWDAVSSSEERKLSELDRRLERSLYRLVQSPEGLK